MKIWDIGKRGMLFVPGKHCPEEAAKAAEECAFFAPDYEEERMAAEETTCYNCRYRRWTPDSFECLKRKR